MTSETRTPALAPTRYPGDLALGGFVDRETMRFVREYPHPPALVWSALTDPAQLGAWLWPCKSFEARLGGVGVFDPGREFQVRITEFEPGRLLNLGGRFRFALEPAGAGCRLTVDLKRPPDGWSPMGLAGFHGWLGRLTRLLAGAPPDETEAWASGDEAALSLCRRRVQAATTRLESAGVPKSRINVGFVLGNYHYLVERDAEAGRAFNRRIELRPVY
jgi:hypothetical protein